MNQKSVRVLGLSLLTLAVVQISCGRKATERADSPPPAPSPLPLVADEIRQIISDNCIACHQADRPAAEIPFQTDENLMGVKSRIVGELDPSNCSMPPNKKEFCATESAKTLVAWAGGVPSVETPMATTPVPTADATPTPAATPTVEATPTPVATATPTPTIEHYADIEPTIRAHCLSCHKPGEKAEEVPFVTKQNVLEVRKDIATVLNPDKCKMPPRKKEFCATDAAIALAKWAASALD